MAYDYERSVISKATGLRGVEADHIAKGLVSMGIDPQVIDWEGAISDARDYGNRYDAVKKYLSMYYGVDIDAHNVSHFNMDQAEESIYADLVGTKKGVKEALKLYYSTNDPNEKEAIKELLLTETPLYNVLMTAMYDGSEMPYAKRFLRENTGLLNGNGGDAVQAAPATAAPVRTVSYNAPVSKVDINDILKSMEKKQAPAPVSKVDINNIKKSISMKKPDAIPQELVDRAARMKRYRESLKKTFTGFAEGVVNEYDLWGNIARKSLKSGKPNRDIQLKGQIKSLKAANEPLRLQLQKERLLMEHEQLKALRAMSGGRTMNPVDTFLAGVVGFLPQNQPLHRPGYYIEARPKLPAGYRWKKSHQPKKTKQSKKRSKGGKTMGFAEPYPSHIKSDVLCPMCGSPMVSGKGYWYCSNPFCGAAFNKR